MSLDVGAVGERRRKEDADRLAGVLSRYYIWFIFLCSDLTRSLQASGTAEQYFTRVFKHCDANSADFDHYLTLFIHHYYCIYLAVIASNTLRSVRSALSCLRKVLINICHVACAWRMLASDEYRRERACDGPREGRDSKCMKQWWRVHIAFTRMKWRIKRRLSEVNDCTCEPYTMWCSTTGYIIKLGIILNSWDKCDARTQTWSYCVNLT